MAAPENQVPRTGLSLIQAPTDAEIEKLRKRGAAAVAYRQEISKIEKQIAGLEWGSGSSVVRGSALSPMTRAVFAEFCALVRANPMYHVDMLGSRPYLNANYWSDLINSREEFHHFEQRDLSPSVEAALRERAASHREIAMTLRESDQDEAARRAAKALDLEEEADNIALARAQWSAPEWAKVVIQTTIWKFIPVAPLDAIRSGEIRELKPYLVPVPECNWAGGRPRAKRKRSKERGGGEYEYDSDPIGNAEPAKTARTRSLRRAAVRAFSTWMEAYERQISKAEEAIEAEFTVIQNDRVFAQASLPAAGASQAIRTGNGDAQAAREPAPKPADAPNAEPAPEFDRDAARRLYFGNLRELGIHGDDARREWQEEHKLPASTKDWGEEHFLRAFSEQVASHRQRYDEGCEVAGVDPEAFAREVLEGELPGSSVKAWGILLAALNARLDGDGGEMPA